MFDYLFFIPPESQRAENIYLNICRRYLLFQEKNGPKNKYKVFFICMREQVIILAEKGDMLD